MDLLALFSFINEQCAMPATLLFVGVGIFLTLKTGFLQIRAFPRFLKLIIQGVPQSSASQAAKTGNTISALHALFTAMGTTIGMGNMVGPTVAIMVGGPGALFWLVLYMFFGAATKLSEVVFAIKTRIKTTDGHVIGGPMEYLREVHPFLAKWYAYVMIFLFAGWSSIQSNTLSTIFSLEGIPAWYVGFGLASLVFIVLLGGVQRVGAVASKLVPFMFVLYVSVSLWILCKDLGAVAAAFRLIFNNIISPSAAMGGFAGATIFQAIRAGIYRGIYITEAGLGVSSIPHAVSDAQRPIDQGVLAMFSVAADMLLSVISGLLVLVTGVWLTGDFRPTLIYEAFKIHAPGASIVLLASMSLFVITTVIGNTFNGSQTFGSLTNYRFVRIYVFVTCMLIFMGSMVKARLAWEMMDTLLTLVAIPNLIGVLILALRHPQELRS